MTLRSFPQLTFTISHTVSYDRRPGACMLAAYYYNPLDSTKAAPIPPCASPPWLVLPNATCPREPCKKDQRFPPSPASSSYSSSSSHEASPLPNLYLPPQQLQQPAPAHILRPLPSFTHHLCTHPFFISSILTFDPPHSQGTRHSWQKLLFLGICTLQISPETTSTASDQRRSAVALRAFPLPPNRSIFPCQVL